MSWCSAFLSSQEFGFEFLSRAMEANARGIGSNAQDDGNLARGKVLPSPQPQHFAVTLGQAVECIVQERIITWCRWLAFSCEASNKFEMTVSTSPLVRQTTASNAVAPSQFCISGDVIHSPPHHEQHIAKNVIRASRIDTSAYVSLKGLIYLSDKRLKTQSVLEHTAHNYSVSYWVRILSLTPYRKKAPYGAQKESKNY
jgi:hypothetical protein